MFWCAFWHALYTIKWWWWWWWKRWSASQLTIEWNSRKILATPVLRSRILTRTKIEKKLTPRNLENSKLWTMGFGWSGLEFGPFWSLGNSPGPKRTRYSYRRATLCFACNARSFLWRVGRRGVKACCCGS